jgi:hypothetical protein
MGLEIDQEAAKQLIERFKSYIRARNNASSWWNDHFAYTQMNWVEEFERKHLASQSTSDCGK